MAKKIILFLAIDYQVIMRIYSLVFLFVEWTFFNINHTDLQLITYSTFNNRQ